MNEVWIDIPQFDGLYQVSSLGRFRSVTRTVRFGKQKRVVPGVILKTSPKGNGYLKISILKRTYLAHRLVASVFVSNPFKFSQVNHKNGNKEDNRVENLEWVTSSQNHKHAYEVLNRQCYSKGRFGKDSNRAKPILQYSTSGLFIAEYSSAAEASRLQKVNESSIRQCIRGKIKLAGSFVWKEKDSNDFPYFIEPCDVRIDSLGRIYKKV